MSLCASRVANREVLFHRLVARNRENAAFPHNVAVGAIRANSFCTWPKILPRMGCMKTRQPSAVWCGIDAAAEPPVQAKRHGPVESLLPPSSGLITDDVALLKIDTEGSTWRSSGQWEANGSMCLCRVQDSSFRSRETIDLHAAPLLGGRRSETWFTSGTGGLRLWG